MNPKKPKLRNIDTSHLCSSPRLCYLADYPERVEEPISHANYLRYLRWRAERRQRLARAAALPIPAPLYPVRNDCCLPKCEALLRSARLSSFAASFKA